MEFFQYIGGASVSPDLGGGRPKEEEGKGPFGVGFPLIPQFTLMFIFLKCYIPEEISSNIKLKFDFVFKISYM